MADHLGAYEQAVLPRFYRLESKGLRALNDTRAAIDNLWQGFKWPLKGSA